MNASSMNHVVCFFFLIRAHAVLRGIRLFLFFIIIIDYTHTHIYIYIVLYKGIEYNDTSNERERFYTRGCIHVIVWVIIDRRIFFFVLSRFPGNALPPTRVVCFSSRSKCVETRCMCVCVCVWARVTYTPTHVHKILTTMFEGGGKVLKTL